jgi:hypothetical protein
LKVAALFQRKNPQRDPTKKEIDFPSGVTNSVGDKSKLYIIQISHGYSLDPRQTQGIDSYGSP